MVSMTKIDIAMRDGACRSWVFRPTAQAGPWRAVLLYMDGIGIRPALLEIGERIAAQGYLVLVPDLYWRAGPYEPMDAKRVFSDPEQRKALMEKFFPHASQANVMSDTQVFLDWLGAEKDVAPGGIATTGYCLGGLMSLTAAGTFPDRIVAAASFHGARLATDAPESPHLLAPRMKARVYVAGAIEDASFDDAMKARLEKALTDAGVEHSIETYPAKHGWVPRDTPVFDEAQSERHYRELFALLAGKLSA